MKKQHLILITVGIIAVAVLMAKNKKGISESIAVIKPGDKGNDIYGLQYALSSMTGVKLGNMGVYDNETLGAVQYYMKDCSALLNLEKGYVRKDFASDLFNIQSQVKKG